MVINKCDRLPHAQRERLTARVEARIRVSNPAAQVIRTYAGRLDPALLFDVLPISDADAQLPFADAHRATHPHIGHETARAVTVRARGPVDPGRLIDLLENPPEGAYRIKGQVGIYSGQRLRGYVVNLVGTTIHLSSATVTDAESHLVAIGHSLQPELARIALEQALTLTDTPRAAGYRRLQRYRRLSA